MKKLAIVCLFAGVTSLLAQSASAQEIIVSQAGGGGTQFLTQRLAGYGGGTYIPEDLSTMLALPQFVEELKITESQQEELAKVRVESQKAIAEAWNAARQPQGGEGGRGGIRQFNAATWQKAREAQKKARAEAEKNVLAVLTDNQKTRLKEIRVQLALKNRGVTSLSVSGGVFGEAINLTDDQKKKLSEKQREIQQELRKIMAELKAEMEQEALDEVLTDSQLETLKKLRGEHYEVKRPDYSKIYGQRSRGPIQQGAKRLLDNIKKDFEDKK